MWGAAATVMGVPHPDMPSVLAVSGAMHLTVSLLAGAVFGLLMRTHSKRDVAGLAWRGAVFGVVVYAVMVYFILPLVVLANFRAVNHGLYVAFHLAFGIVLGISYALLRQRLGNHADQSPAEVLQGNAMGLATAHKILISAALGLAALLLAFGVVRYLRFGDSIALVTGIVAAALAVPASLYLRRFFLRHSAREDVSADRR